MAKATKEKFFADWVDWKSDDDPTNPLPLDYDTQWVDQVENKEALIHKKGKLLKDKIPDSYPSDWKNHEGKVFIFRVAIDGNTNPILGSSYIAAPCPPFCDDGGERGNGNTA